MTIGRGGGGRLGRLPDWTWSAGAVLAVAADLRGHLLVGWIPHDEGALATAATLVRNGAWPHRDFADIYSGGLAVLGAGWQSVAGDSLVAARYLLFVATLCWIPVLVACLRRHVSPPSAALLAVVAYAWGPPLYTAAMPTWFLLFLATAMLWALLRWQETGHRIFLAGAGAAIGAGVLVKVNGLFLLAAAIAVVVTHPAGAEREAADRWSWPGAVVLAGASLAASALLLGGWPWWATLGLALPLVILAAAWGWLGSAPGAGGRDRWRTATLEVAALLAGLAAIVVPWIAAYAATGAGMDLWHGIFEAPFRRVSGARAVPPLMSLRDLFVAGALVALLRLRGSGAAVRVATLGIVALTLGVVRVGTDEAWRVTAPMWGVVRVLIPTLLIVAGLRAQNDPGREARALGAAVWVVAWLALVQYPFATPIYIAYIAPLVVLPAAGLASRWRTARPVAWALGLGALLLTGTLGHGLAQYRLGLWEVGSLPLTPLPGPRGGLLVTGGEAAAYGALTSTLDRWHADRIIAGPDAPEVYYLTGRPKLDRDLFEFFDPAWSARTFARRIDSLRPDAVVLNLEPGFSRIDSDSVLGTLTTPWRADTTIGRFRLLRLAGPDAHP